MGKNVIIIAADMNPSVHVDSKEKHIFILGEEPTQGLDDTTLTAEAKYPIMLLNEIKDLYYVCTIKEVTVSCLLMLQKHINLKQKTQK